jgi:hypothetical protein
LDEQPVKTVPKSYRGGSRTHTREALDLAALPICVPGRELQVRESHPAAELMRLPWTLVHLRQRKHEIRMSKIRRGGTREARSTKPEKNSSAPASSVRSLVLRASFVIRASDFLIGGPALASRAGPTQRVTKGRIELPSPFGHDGLSVACLPVSPLGQRDWSQSGPCGNRTRFCGGRGRRPRPIDERANHQRIAACFLTTALQAATRTTTH